MKKILIITLATGLVAVGLQSCQKTKVLEPTVIKFHVNFAAPLGTGDDTDAWVEDGVPTNENYQYRYNKSIPSITQDVLDNGAVLAYIRVMDNICGGISAENEGNAWAAMPYTETRSGYILILGYQCKPGLFSFTRKDTDLITATDNYFVKVVVLSAVEKNILIEAGVDQTNHNAVMDLLDREIEN
jgi:hypothetical protein